eukprot:scaffold131155_cov31-Tisochrysis_lutea.AAC.2
MTQGTGASGWCRRPKLARSLPQPRLLVKPPYPLLGYLRVELSQEPLGVIERQLGHHVLCLGAHAGASPALTPVGNDVYFARADVFAQRAHALEHHAPDLLDDDEHARARPRAAPRASRPGPTTLAPRPPGCDGASCSASFEPVPPSPVRPTGAAGRCRSPARASSRCRPRSRSIGT